MPADIGRIIISHGHVDHIGSIAEGAATFHLPIAVHPLDRGAVASHLEYVAVSKSRFSQFLSAGVDARRHVELRKDFHFHERQLQNVPVAMNLEDGDELDGLRIIHTPGHSPGHICIGVGNVLLSADHILALTHPSRMAGDAMEYTGISHYLESLEKIRQIAGFEVTLAAHEQVIHDLYGRIKTIRLGLGVSNACWRCSQNPPEPLSVQEIALQMYPEMTGFRAVLSRLSDIGARVEYLHRHGRLAVANLDEVERDQNPVYRYGLAYLVFPRPRLPPLVPIYWGLMAREPILQPAGGVQ